MDATLVVMAAGIGSRFGGGIKQLAPVGPCGEIIMDYSIYDAKEAGFNKVVFIIRHDLEKDFKEIIGDRIKKYIDVDYAFQELDDLPEGFTCPKDRTKPWGTGQALLSVKGLVNEPFIVINADDYYGKEGFKVVYDYMKNHMKENGEKIDLCMAGFVLKNTLSDNGGVTRGVCKADADNKLVDVTETFDIELKDGVLSAVDENKQKRDVDLNDIVSMNMWGLTPKFLDILEEGFPKFLKSMTNELKSEYLLPSVIDEAIKSGKASVEVLKSHDKWFGVTYKEDKELVVNSIRALVDKGVYPEKIFS
nr:sugar phosphate nucleotidyltransferase [uncultured Lachnoanaerobaculum sp.]